MSLRSKFQKQLEKQIEIEGPSENTDLLLKILPHVKLESQWRAITVVSKHRYGRLSYQEHNFYNPNQFILDVKDMISRA